MLLQQGETSKRAEPPSLNTAASGRELMQDQARCHNPRPQQQPQTRLRATHKEPLLSLQTEAGPCSADVHVAIVKLQLRSRPGNTFQGLGSLLPLLLSRDSPVVPASGTNQCLQFLRCHPSHGSAPQDIAQPRLLLPLLSPCLVWNRTRTQTFGFQTLPNPDLIYHTWLRSWNQGQKRP